MNEYEKEVCEIHGISKHALEQAKNLVYLKYGIIPENNKPLPEEVITIAKKISSEQYYEKVKNDAIESIKDRETNKPEYRPNAKRVSKRKLKMIILMIVSSLMSSLVALGIAAGAKKLSEHIKDEILKIEAEKRISQVYAGVSDGINAYHGDMWYEANLFADEIIEQKTFDDAEELYMQLSRLYVGLKDKTTIEDPKLSSGGGGSYTPEEWIEMIYETLNQRVQAKYGIQIGPEEFSGFIKSIDKLPEDQDPYDAMEEAYLKYKEAIKIQIENNPNFVVLTPTDDAKAAAFDDIASGRIGR